MIRPARLDEMPEVRTMFEEYQRFLDFDLCFQGFQNELDSLPGDYQAPDGCLLLAVDGDQKLGCIAARRLDETTCEMKRLYLRPESRGKGLGKKLCCELIDWARDKGYRSMKLDTVSKLKKAIEIYREFGFVETSPYCENPRSDVKFFELCL